MDGGQVGRKAGVNGRRGFQRADDIQQTLPLKQEGGDASVSEKIRVSSPVACENLLHDSMVLSIFILSHQRGCG